MKKFVVLLVSLVLLFGAFGCKSAPTEKPQPTAVITKFKSVYVDLAYDPVLLITYKEKTDIIEDLQGRLNAMGFVVSQSPDKSDMIMKITIDELILSERNQRLMARTTFGLVKDKSSMKYTVSFINNKTYEEITSKKGEYRFSKYFPSKEEIKGIFFTQMKDDIVNFILESSVF